MPELDVQEQRERVVQRLVILLASNRFATLSSVLAQAFDAGRNVERHPPIAYIHRAPDGTETVFKPEEIWIVREGTDG